MIKVFISLVLLLSLNISAQVSYEFMEPLPPESSTVSSTDLAHFGVYKADSSDIVFEFNSTGIFTRNLVVHTISRETIRESSSFQVRGNYLFGVAENDSFPCVLEGENYFFGVNRKDTIVGTNSKNQLKKINTNSYILNFSENGLYTPCLIQFEKTGMSLHYFDYANDTNVFSKIKSQQTESVNELKTVYLLPSLKEWNKMDKQEVFGTPVKFNRTR